MLQIELTEGDCVNGSAGCKMGEAVTGSLGPGRIGREARGLPTSHAADRPPSAGESPALLPPGLGKAVQGDESQARPRVLRVPLHGALQGRLTGRQGACSRWQLSLLRWEKMATGRWRQVSQQQEYSGTPRKEIKEREGWRERSSSARSKLKSVHTAARCDPWDLAFAHVTTQF